MKRIIIALGGNALEDSSAPTAENQLKVIKSNVVYLADLIEKGYEVVITHGNGPQVGRILLQSEAGKNITPPLPFDVCGAMSQGMIGYQIQQALGDELKKRSINKGVVSLITQVLVDPKDPAFSNPSKPIGPFYTEEEAISLEKSYGYTVKEDSGRGWRRVVASPLPVAINELSSIESLLEAKQVVIACGGGGVPVIKKGESLEGIAAVIDKDFASAKLAEDLKADTLIILTAVPKVAINFGKSNQENLSELPLNEVEKYIEEGQFGKGSMLPKVQACASFVKSSSNRKSLITSLSSLKESLEGKNGTWII